MSWFRLARRGAAYEFGRRMWRWFAAYEVIRWLARRILPTLLILVALVSAGWLAARTAVWWLPRLTALVVIAATLAAAVWLARRYRWELRAGLPRTAVAALALVLAGVVGTAVYHLR